MNLIIRGKNTFNVLIFHESFIKSRRGSSRNIWLGDGVQDSYAANL